ncbi:hypothetical protein DFJ73DRAFT_840428 [Zopfochytrium polystomum]|nr:hypothetical protein DFJ73DRAFT_840428 [Zopfochytrium polystomum]
MPAVARSRHHHHHHTSPPSIDRSDFRALASQLAPNGGGGSDRLDGECDPADPAHVPADDDYDVSHLDYAWVAQATSIDELSKLLRVLRSGKEGFYPDLEKAFLQRIETLDPKRRVDRVVPPSFKEIQKISHDLLSWAETIKSTDSLLKQSEKTSNKIVSLPPVRNKNNSVDKPAPATREQTKDIFEDASREESDSSRGSSSDDGESDSKTSSSSSTSSQTSPRPEVRGILKSPSPDSAAKKHVRFKDQVDALQKAALMRKQKEERRKHVAEMQAQKAASKKRRKPKKGHHPSSPPEVIAPEANPIPASKTALTETKESATSEDCAKPEGSSRIKSYDYRAWDRLDVDSELKRLDEETAPKSKARINKVSDSVVPTDVTSPLSDPKEVELLADKEKIKGNEAFKAGDWQEAFDYYTRSLSLMEKANVYTNRAITGIKLGKFELAEDDCTRALSLNDPEFNFKAYLRRGSARIKRGRYAEAVEDLDQALALSPGNKEVGNLRREAENKLKSVEGDAYQAKLKPKTKLKIVEVDEDDVEGEIVTPLARQNALTQAQRSSIDQREGSVGLPFNERVPSYSNLSPESLRKLKGKRPAHEADEAIYQTEPIEQTNRAAPRSSEAPSPTSLDTVSALDENALKEVKIMADLEAANSLSKRDSGIHLVVEDVDEDSDVDAEATVEEPVPIVPFPAECNTTRESCQVDDVENSEKAATSKPSLSIQPESLIAAHRNSLKRSTPEASMLLAAHCFTPPLQPPAKTSYEFEGVWRTIRQQSDKWMAFVHSHSPERLLTVMAKVGNPSVLPDVFRAMNLLLEQDRDYVVESLEQFRKLPRLAVLVGFFSKAERADFLQLLDSVRDASPKCFDGFKSLTK